MKLVQLHWQDRADFNRTEFVAQGEFSGAAAFDAWIADVMTRRGSECPDGWCPVILEDTHPRFVMQPA